MSKSQIKKSKQKKIIIFLLAFWIIGTCTLLLIKYFYAYPIRRATLYPELQELTDNTYTYQQLKNYFTKLAQKKGGEYAYSILAKADIPPNTDVHLLGHVVGEQLYIQKGIEGMEYCTQDFRNACSHSIVVGTLLQYGPTKNIFAHIDAACKKAPGGFGAYELCYHGLGHGILAYTNYDMEKAARLCEKTIPLGKNKAYAQCISGTIMEIIGGGDHDKTTWRKQSEKYLSNPNPLSLCQNSYTKKAASYLCYTYLTPHLMNLAGFKPQNTHDPTSFQKAFTYCDALPKTDTRNRDACFGGFGKEFIVLARNRDIRDISTMSDTQLKTSYSWCTLAPSPKGIRSCVYASINSLLWGGENQPEAAIRFCSLIPDAREQDDCFLHLLHVTKTFIKTPVYTKKVCLLLPKNYKDICQK